MLEYRVTKYDPAIRSDGGRYTEWTSVSDIGAAFDATVLAQTAYEEVEAACVSTQPQLEADVNGTPQIFQCTKCQFRKCR